MIETIKVGKLYCGGPWSPASKIVFDPVNYAVVGIDGRELHVAADNCTVTMKVGENMLDLFKEFKDWLSYNHPGVKPEPFQEDLMKIALHNWSTKVPKTASKALLRELAKLVLTGTK